MTTANVIRLFDQSRFERGQQAKRETKTETLVGWAGWPAQSVHVGKDPVWPNGPPQGAVGFHPVYDFLLLHMI